MKTTLKNIKIDNFVNSYIIQPFSKINKKRTIVNRSCSCLMIKTKGTTLYFFNGNEYVCDEKHVIFIPRGSNYDLIVKDNGECYQINFNTTFDLTNVLSIEITKPEIIDLFIESKNSYENDPTNITKQLSIIYAIFVKLLEELDKKNDYLSLAIKVIQKEISNPNLDNNFIANQINISEVYLRKIFKKQMRTSPRQYLIKVRMEKALNMLFNNLSIKEISQKVGYDSVYSFSRAFKSFYKKSPQKYIKHF